MTIADNTPAYFTPFKGTKEKKQVLKSYHQKSAIVEWNPKTLEVPKTSTRPLAETKSRPEKIDKDWDFDFSDSPVKKAEISVANAVANDDASSDDDDDVCVIPPTQAIDSDEDDRKSAGTSPILSKFEPAMKRLKLFADETR